MCRAPCALAVKRVSGRLRCTSSFAILASSQLFTRPTQSPWRRRRAGARAPAALQGAPAPPPPAPHPCRWSRRPVPRPAPRRPAPPALRPAPRRRCARQRTRAPRSGARYGDASECRSSSMRACISTISCFVGAAEVMAATVRSAASSAARGQRSARETHRLQPCHESHLSSGRVMSGGALPTYEETL